MLSDVLGRNGRIGRKFIWGSEEKRKYYSTFKRMLNFNEIQARELLSKDLKPNTVIDPDIGYLAYNVDVNSNHFLRLKELTLLEKESVKERLILNSGFKDYYNSGKIDQDPSLLQEVLQDVLSDELLSTVSNYLGVVPVIKTIELKFSDYSREKVASQLYHSDWEDITQIKLFINITDVTKKNGPLNILSAKQSKEIMNSMKFNYLKNYYSSDDIIESNKGEIMKNEFTGKAGSAILADTSSCFHYGSRIRLEKEYRLALLVQFVRPQAFCFNWRFQSEHLLRHCVESDMTDLQKLALGYTTKEI